MSIPLQPILENDSVLVEPLTSEDVDSLYCIASDPAIWAQHPNKDRYKREVFEQFFQGAIESKGAFKIINKQLGKLVGSTRFYDYDPMGKSICIGYTFYATNVWGTGFNIKVKQLMLEYIFQYVEKVYFHVGVENFRSQKAVERLGAVKVEEKNVAYYNEPPKLNYIYQILRPKL
ncbi:MAG: N-acetyltransferase [Pseudopedobacter saltans]|uniref:N-acetyltransferase n=1 Tax=Pseudopedobacter saltans TaxID=151895 RepID=A0A2W5EKW7_9SPHI|nr:MAG: N-acetyltransferase [Pseudopedobacter saltans]